MSLKLIKTNSSECPKCKHPNLVLSGLGWTCLSCNIYIWPQLKKEKK